MNETVKKKHMDRSITVDFGDRPTYHRLCADGKAFVEYIVAFLTSFGFQLLHKCDCPGGTCLTRHSHYMRIRLGGLVIWRVQCRHCDAVFTILPHFVLRYRSMTPEQAKQALIATHGGLSLEWTATIIPDVSVMSVYRLVCALGTCQLADVLTRCHLPLPAYLVADEKHAHCLREKVYLPTIVVGRVIWHLGYTPDKSAAAFEACYREFEQAVHHLDGRYRPCGILTDSFESTRKSLHAVFPFTKLGNCLLHATARVGQKLQGVTKAVRKRVQAEFAGVFQDRQGRQQVTLCSLGQTLSRFGKKVSQWAGKANGTAIRDWIQRKKDGWYVVFRDRAMPAMSTTVDQAHNALDRKLFMMKGFHHPDGHQQAFLNGVAMLYNFVPYQRRAVHAGRCGVHVEGGVLPSDDWFLSLRIVTSGGLQSATLPIRSG